jgi:hypothetical protein
MVANRNWATVLWPYYEGGGSACCLAMFAFACTKIMRVVTSNRLNKTVMLAFFCYTSHVYLVQEHMPNSSSLQPESFVLVIFSSTLAISWLLFSI